MSLKIRDNKYFMKIALKEAEKALKSGDVPIGCVIVLNNEIIGRGYNQIEKTKNPLAHAEIIAIKKAVKKVGYKHLLDSTIYVTLEPCSMCAGAIVLSRIKKLVFAAKDPKTGAAGSIFNITQEQKLNHRLELENGIFEEESSQLIKNFFKNLRKSKKDEN